MFFYHVVSDKPKYAGQYFEVDGRVFYGDAL